MSVHLNEFEIAEKIKSGDLPSPFKYSNMWLVNIRITGTGMAYRSGLNEHVWRDPEIYLNNEFLSRINGLPAICNHPKLSLLNEKEFKDRIVGAVMLPYIRGDEVWAIVRIYVEEMIDLILKEEVSTSPAVSFNQDSGNILIENEESHLLIEGKPALIDHIAFVTEKHGSLGVWDKNQVPEGVEVSNKEGKEMNEEDLKKMLDALTGSIANQFDAVNNRLDSMQSTNRADASKKDEHIENDKTKHKQVLNKLEEIEDRSDSDEKESMRKEISELKSRLDNLSHEKKRDCKDSDEKKHRKDESEYDKKEREKGRDEEKEEVERKERKDASKQREIGREEEKEKMKRHREDRHDDDENRFSRTAEDKEEDERKDNAMTDARVKADSAFSACGKKAPKPFDGESSLAYRKRVLSAMQKHSPSYKDVQIRNIHDSATLAMAEKNIYADAAEAIKKERQNTTGHLYEVVKTDAANRQITAFEGDPNAWLAAFKMPARYVQKFNTNVRNS